MYVYREDRILIAMRGAEKLHLRASASKCTIDTRTGSGRGWLGGSFICLVFSMNTYKYVSNRVFTISP